MAAKINGEKCFFIEIILSMWTKPFPRTDVGHNVGAIWSRFNTTLELQSWKMPLKQNSWNNNKVDADEFGYILAITLGVG